MARWRAGVAAVALRAAAGDAACVAPSGRPPPLPTAQQASRGPAAGALVVVGGHAAAPAIYDRVLSLAGGPGAAIAYVPTNSGADYSTAARRQAAVDEIKALSGWADVRLVHTYDPQEANTSAFAAQLANVSGVWFGGGRQWRCADAYLGTKAEAAFAAVLSRGGVIGGSSAGASIQGDFLVRGDTQNNWRVIGDHTKGFGYVTNVGFDQHFLKRNREWDMIEVVEAHPQVLGVSIDENTAVVIQGDEFEVIGENYVAVTDATLWPDKDYCAHYELACGRGRPLLAHGGRFFFLKAHGTGNTKGDKYNIRTREVTSQDCGED